MKIQANRNQELFDGRVIIECDDVTFYTFETNHYADTGGAYAELMTFQAKVTIHINDKVEIERECYNLAPETVCFGFGDNDQVRIKLESRDFMAVKYWREWEEALARVSP